MKYDKKKYKVWNWRHPIMLHWIINPGCAVSEFMGIITPKVMLIERDKFKGLAQRTFIPCPHCDTLHPGMKFSKQNNTHNKNWFGYYCDSCGEVIPPLRNWLSALVFILTKPFTKKWKKRWLEKQPQRYATVDLTPVTKKITTKQMVKLSLFFAGFMFVFMTLFNWAIGTTINAAYVIINLFMWTIGGFAFGYIMTRWANYNVDKNVKAQLNLENTQK